METGYTHILRAHGLGIAFDGIPLLKGVDLELPWGGRTVLLGDNGVGKTTLLKILALVLSASHGFLELFGMLVRHGMSVSSLAFLRSRIGVVWQHTLLEGEASCWENVLTTAVYGGVPRADRPWRAEVALEAVGLLHRARHKAGKLNGGDRKKLALAQAIVRIDDGLLLLDEPTAHLSERAAEEILFLLQHLNVTQGCTILAITHDLRWAAKFSPHWYRLFDGRLTRDQPGPPVPAATPEAARPPLSGTPVVLGPVLPREGGKRNWPLMVRGDSQCLRLVPRGVH